MLPHALSHYIRTSIMSHTTNGSFTPHSSVPGIFFKFDIEPVRLTLIQRTTTLAQFFIRSVTFFHSASSHHSHFWFHSCVGVIGGIFVCASWGLRRTDRMISVVAGPDDTDSIVPPNSARSGGLRSKWTGGALRACPSTATLRPSGWIPKGGGAGGSPYSGASSYASSPAGSPVQP